jgi:redox-sensitive bicupin YhaK (pirin superfamily)
MILHPADSRGKADRGWLQSCHTFSFANYYDPERTNFGSLRVINDDIIAPGKGFGRHPHRDMEIITIPLEGSLKHEDSLGSQGIITRGEVQVMSAGTGIFHSEFSDASVVSKLLQIWVLPKKLGVTPRYDQKAFPHEQRKNAFQLIVSPDGRQGSLAINQEAFFSLVEISSGNILNYKPFETKNGVYLFVISGSLLINGIKVYPRDGLGLEVSEVIKIEALSHSEILLMEVPMN